MLREQINASNKPELNSTFQIQIEAIRSAAEDLEKVEDMIEWKKELLKNSKDIQETDRLLAELDALEWVQGQIANSFEKKHAATSSQETAPKIQQ